MEHQCGLESHCKNEIHKTVAALYTAGDEKSKGTGYGEERSCLTVDLL